MPNLTQTCKTDTLPVCYGDQQYVYSDIPVFVSTEGKRMLRDELIDSRCTLKRKASQ